MGGRAAESPCGRCADAGDARLRDGDRRRRLQPLRRAQRVAPWATHAVDSRPRPQHPARRPIRAAPVRGHPHSGSGTGRLRRGRIAAGRGRIQFAFQRGPQACGRRLGRLGLRFCRRSAEAAAGKTRLFDRARRPGLRADLRAGIACPLHRAHAGAPRRAAGALLRRRPPGARGRGRADQRPRADPADGRRLPHLHRHRPRRGQQQGPVQRTGLHLPHRSPNRR